MSAGKATKRREEVSAGGVVIRREPAGVQLVLAEQIDRHRQERTVRLPKGHIDPGETQEQAALREVLEETGIEARVLAPLTDVAYRFYHAKKDRHIPKRVHFFLMEHASGDPRPADGEMDRVYWSDLEEALTRLTYENERGVVREAFALLDAEPTPASS